MASGTAPCLSQAAFTSGRLIALLISALSLSTIGFGAPLMRFTSFDGLTFHVGSSESGTGKSVSLEMAASIWGHPTRYMVGKDTSGVAMQQRLGLLNSLPLICDEITQKNRKDFEWFPGFVFDMTDGKGKERMEGGSNKERVNTTYWSTLALVSSNTHIMDYLSSRKHSSQGEIMRLLELQMNKRLDAADDLADALKNILPNNYGVAGAVFARWLVNNQPTVRDVVRMIEEDLKKTMQETADERFWIAGIAACIAGGVLMHRFKLLQQACETWVAAMAAAPLVLAYPLFMVIFGRNAWTIIMMGFFAALPPVVVNVSAVCVPHSDDEYDASQFGSAVPVFHHFATTSLPTARTRTQYVSFAAGAKFVAPDQRAVSENPVAVFSSTSGTVGEKSSAQ